MQFPDAHTATLAGACPIQVQRAEREYRPFPNESGRNTGLRRALGATKASGLLLVLRQAVGVVAVGVAAGCWSGWSVWNVLPTILRGAATWDTSSLAMAALPLALAMLVGASLPAGSALRDAPAHLIASTG
jgi:hypothetical protein